MKSNQAKSGINIVGGIKAVALLIMSIGVVAFLVVGALVIYSLSKKDDSLPVSTVAAQEYTVEVESNPINWQEVEAGMRSALDLAREEAESYADEQFAAWFGSLMKRVDNSFIPWYFDYFIQQKLGLVSLFSGDAALEDVNEQFANRVFTPEVAQQKTDRIIQKSAELYFESLGVHSENVRDKYTIPPEIWERYLARITLMTVRTNANREIPLTYKTATVSAALAAGLIYKTVKPVVSRAITKVASKMSTKVALATATKIAARQGVKTGGKTVLKITGTGLAAAIGAGVIIWDIYDHHITRKEGEPLLRRNIEDFFEGIRQELVYGPSSGLQKFLSQIEPNILAALKSQGNSPEFQTALK